MNCNVMNCSNENNNELKIMAKIYQFDLSYSILLLLYCRISIDLVTHNFWRFHVFKYLQIFHFEGLLWES